MDAWSAVREISAQIAPAAREEARSQAALLVAHVLGVELSELYLRGGELCEAQCAALSDLAHRRGAGEPLQYILGEWELMGLPFHVDRRALIPRQDTETVIEAALELIASRGYKTALDLCCGGGCIGVCLAARSRIDVTMSDISEVCLELAHENAELNGVGARCVRGDLFEAASGERFDIIVCNPPYIRRAELTALQRELTYEPALALDGGEDGLEFYRRIAARFDEHLNAGGALVLEMGYNQADEVAALFGGARIVRDMSGSARCAVVER
ncbi:MAG: peptide chain release factor N(5)-glutamine methyltransferase [Clostridia bacterium]|nr:peptide chain release factor N(5)-glutamine methyltransferase [Clostridia bacterium]